MIYRQKWNEATLLREVGRENVIHPGRLALGDFTNFLFGTQWREMMECGGTEQKMEGSRHQRR